MSHLDVLGATDPLPADPELRAELAAARDRAEQFLAAAKAPATLRAYTADWADWTSWCARYGLAPLPARPEAVALYLGARADTWAWTTIAGRLAAIAHFHEDAGYPSPTSHPLVRRIRSGIRRTVGTAGVGKQPLRYDHLAAMVAAIRRDSARQPLARLRDPALLLLGFALGRRRSELVALRVSDLAPVEGEGLSVLIARSKTDQSGKGARVPVPFNHAEPDLCPVTATVEWCRALGVEQYLGRRRDPAAALPVFRGLTKHGTVRQGPLSDRHVVTVIKDAIVLAGLDLDVDDFSGHSLRAGLVSAAREAGAQDSAIMKQTGHSRLQTLTDYARGNLFRDNAATAVFTAGSAGAAQPGEPEDR